MIEQQENGWQLNNGNYYKVDGDNISASLQHFIPERDGHPYERWGVQISTSDGWLAIVGYIADIDFNPTLAKAIADMAVQEGKDRGWWAQNHISWWASNTVYAAL